MVNMKTCTKCGKEKELTDYYKHKDSKDGHQTYCKLCAREAMRQHRRKKGVTKQLSKTETFSTERYCDVCMETKDWKVYYAEQGMCRDCWRKRLSDMALGSPEPHHSSTKKKQTLEDMLAQIEAITAKM